MRASRPEFRRGGHFFGNGQWTMIDPATGPADLRALLAEPVLAAQGETAEDVWETVPVTQRAAAVAYIDALLAGHAEELDLSFLTASRPEARHSDNPREHQPSEAGGGDPAAPGSDDGRVELTAIAPSPGDGRTPLAPAAPPEAPAPAATAKVQAKPKAAPQKAKARK